MIYTTTAARTARRSVRTFLALTCAACFTWLALAPTAAATPTDREQHRQRQQNRQDIRLIEHGGGLPPLQRSGPPPSLANTPAGARQEARATVRECEAACVGCAAALLGLTASTAGIAVACGGAVFTGGLALGACWIAIAGAPSIALMAASNCSGCDHCLNAPDPEPPPGGGGGSDECYPCDPDEPLADCLDPVIDWCEDEEETGNP